MAQLQEALSGIKPAHNELGISHIVFTAPSPPKCYLIPPPNPADAEPGKLYTKPAIIISSYPPDYSNPT
ncbi:hypothetical protein A3D78_07690 [Candidatus Gottesmanbacteria bacterium RIFCSPHIGHO2_02_FULL_39_14]|uniref:Uncharacterized protein n=1 Tax=Candidatus Gottesmanbacteria bacterium RIFCSPHIGHO2_02_FULL_39_14 TaxID=1798383 RepID=A0A1F5ZVZ1_9BACT|nr:MAG: hypothetical protein A3D78_07690 [Candidatus Gottesmanbacteria bacterium RIFCSPHIGHO2_02_FULL_39_14]